ncbi:MAG: phosphoribosylglycinamide formyltransferase [Kiritimatiellae bacterium]|nr:phosphoribosylglycinamide formyltransferase [Kiritimatiellia bacterium]
MKLKLAVLGSGSGSNMQSIVDAIEAGTLDAEIVCVLSDVPDAKILERAAKHHLPGQYVSCEPFKTKLDGEAQERYIRIMKDAGADTVVLAGFMRIVKQGLLDAFPNRVLNIHPALLPAFPGLHSWKQALDYGAKVAGCTVHFVDAGTDSGPIIVQKCVPVEETDTPETLHARIQVQEHLAFPEALRHLAAGRLRIEGRRVIIG